MTETEISKLKKRTEKLEKLYAQLENYANAKDSQDTDVVKTIQLINERMTQFDELLAGFFKAASVDMQSVEKAIEENRENRAQEDKRLKLEGYEKAVAEGYMTKGGSPNDRSIICGVERKPDGSPAKKYADGWFWKQFSQLKDEIKVLFEGKVPGDTVQLPQGASYDLQEVYTVDPEKLMEYRARKQVEAQQEAALAQEQAKGEANE